MKYYRERRERIVTGSNFASGARWLSAKPVAIAPCTDVMKQAPPTVSAKLTAQSLRHETERRRYGCNIYRR